MSAVDPSTALLAVHALEAPFADLMNLVSRDNDERTAYREQITSLSNSLNGANVDLTECRAKIQALESLINNQNYGPWQRIRSAVRRTLRVAMRIRAG